VPVVQRYSEIREALGIVKPRFQPSEHITNFEGPSQARNIRLLAEISRIFASWNQLDAWVRQVDQLRRVA
jgi:hypothetical protein